MEQNKAIPSFLSVSAVLIIRFAVSIIPKWILNNATNAYIYKPALLRL